MKQKFGIKTRVFLGFGLFIIIIINIFLYLLYLGFEKSFISSIKINIEKKFEIIKNSIDEKKGGYFLSVPADKMEEMKKLGFFVYLGKDDEEIKNNYQIGYFFYGKDIIFRGDYKGYNILIGKNVSDFFDFKQKILEVMLFADLIGIFVLVMMIYFITNKLLKPLLELSKNISKYDIEKNKEFLKNNFGESEIGLITESTNKLILKSKNILEAQKRFIQDSSHELKTPLMQIDSNIEILEEKIYDKKILQKLENIKSASENINKIVSNLSFILREENKNYSLEKINLEKYLKNLAKSFESEAKQKNISIEIIKNFDLEIENNTYFLDRLFGNLIQNSIFYNNGNNKILINIFEDKIILKDFGIGIEKSEIENIFDRFFRNKNSGIYNQKGNGLGLTIVKKICDDFGWEIKINSEIGEGSEFEIIF